jgi:riboflavin synthase
MFTGIIESIGSVVSADKVAGDVRLLITAPEFAESEIALGDSIACSGVCLTVVAREDEQLAFDVSLESLNHTLIGDWLAGTKINLEQAMTASTRLGGHLVSGHVDGVAELQEISVDARSSRMVFRLPNELKKYAAKKGSITVNGVSLTVNAVEDTLFDINVIPHTLKVTTLGKLTAGDQVHIEVDLIARYVERLMTVDSQPLGSTRPNQSESILT